MKLTILATSDLHGYIEPTNFGSRGQNQPFGAAKAATVIEAVRNQASGPIVVIENGDFIQGSPLSYYIAKQQAGSPELLTNVANAIGYDVGILGNHEFNYGRDYLEQATAAYHYPILCANIIDSNGSPAFGKAYTILEKDGLKIAILGLTTSYIPNWEHPSHIEGLQFLDVAATAKKYVPKLRELADIVIVSYHGGFERDLTSGEPTEALTKENQGYQLLEEVTGIDALVTGHQHRVLADTINGVPIIQPGFRGEYVGQIVLELAADNGTYSITSATPSLLATKDAIPDKTVSEQIAPIASKVENWLDAPLGKVSGDMRITDPDKARLCEHPYVEFIQQVQMEASGAAISGTALFNNEGTGFGDTITMRDVVTNYIYPNTLAVLKVTGADLRAALERSASFFQMEADGSIGINPTFISPKPQYYNYDMYEGINYTIHVQQPIGERVFPLLYKGKQVQPDDVLEIVINQYRAVGGGDYPMFDASKIVREIQIDMTELIADYLKRHPIVTAMVNNNFQVKI